LLPSGFVEETLKTTDLLIPLIKATCNGWLADEIKTWQQDLDVTIRNREMPDFNKQSYGYWQDRLVAIEDAFERTKPKNIIQWWHDRRDMQQWWAFWLVISGIFLTVLFGLAQSVTGIIQVVLATRQVCT
jgi:hypothetical protein